jgi:hypothetical protein
MIAENGQVCIADYGMVEMKPSGSASAHQYFSSEAWKGVRVFQKSMARLFHWAII